MRFNFCLLVLTVCLPCFANEEYRIFTSTDGKAIEARILSVDARSGKVTVQPQNKRRMTVPSSIFSESDQAYIKEWVSAQDFLSNSRLRISVEKRKGRTGDSRSQTKREKPPCHYEIQLQNKSAIVFENIWIEYCTFMNKESSHQGADKLTSKHAKSNMIQLQPRASHTEESKQIKLYRYYTMQIEESTDIYGNIARNTSYNKVAEDKLEGIRVRVFIEMPSGARFSREICEPSSVAKEFEWKVPQGILAGNSSQTDSGSSGSSKGASKSTPATRFRKHDINVDGQITLEEYIKVRLKEAKRQKKDHSVERITSWFKGMDVNNDGYISPDEMK